MTLLFKKVLSIYEKCSNDSFYICFTDGPMELTEKNTANDCDND